MSACVEQHRHSIDGCYFNALAWWVPHARAEVAGTQWHCFCWWLHFRLPALAFNIPPRIALVGEIYGFDVSDDDEFRVGTDRRVRPC